MSGVTWLLGSHPGGPGGGGLAHWPDCPAAAADSTPWDLVAGSSEDELRRAFAGHTVVGLCPVCLPGQGAGYPDPRALGGQLFSEMVGQYMAPHAIELSRGGGGDWRTAHRNGIAAALRYVGCTLPVTEAMVDAAAGCGEIGGALRAALAAGRAGQ